MISEVPEENWKRRNTYHVIFDRKEEVEDIERWNLRAFSKTGAESGFGFP